MREGFREVAIRMCPCDWTARARVRPKPEEQPVMSHTSGLWGIVNVDMLVILNLRSSFQGSFIGLSSDMRDAFVNQARSDSIRQDLYKRSEPQRHRRYEICGLKTG